MTSFRNFFDNLDLDLPVEAGNLGRDLFDPGHDDGEALDEVSFYSHLKQKLCTESGKKEKKLTFPFLNSFVNLMAHNGYLLQVIISSVVIWNIDEY